MEISLSIEERPPVLRAFLEALQAALGADARVWASLVAGDEHAPQRIAAFIQVFEAPDRDAAFQRVRPAIRAADPEEKLVKADETFVQAHETVVTNERRVDDKDAEVTELRRSAVSSASAEPLPRQQRFELSA